MKDKTLINKLFWLKKALDNHFGNEKYLKVYDKELSDDVMREVDELVQYIKENY